MPLSFVHLNQLGGVFLSDGAFVSVKGENVEVEAIRRRDVVEEISFMVLLG